MGDLTFDEKEHRYFHDGVEIPRLTRLIESFGLIKHKATEGYLQRGSAIHLALQYYDEGDLDEEALDPQIRPWFDAYKQFREDTGFKPVRIEKKAHNDQHLFATIVDRTGTINGSEVLLELKSGSKSDWWGLQLAGQQIALQQEFKKRYALELSKEGKYKLHPFHEQEYLDIFYSMLNVNAWRRNHGY